MIFKVLFPSLFSLSLLLISCGGDKGTEPSNPKPSPEPTPEQPSVEPKKDVKVLTTSATRRYDLDESWLEFSQGSSGNTNTVELKPDETYQTIDGFGAAITGSTAYNLKKMNQENRTAFLKQTFSPTEGYGFSYVRVPIGCSDFSLSEYTCCDTPGIENFALTNEETDYIIPVLKEILAINPNLKIMGSPWTAPTWMKVKDLDSKLPYQSWTSGQLNPDYYQDYATYFKKWIEAFGDNGIKIYSITPQNEPLNRGNSASMYMSWQEERDFIKEALGPTLRGAGLNTKIYAFDHNYDYDGHGDQVNYPGNIYEDAEASQYVAGAAFHNYGGNINELTRVHNAYPDKELVFTESTAGDWNDGANLQKRLIDDMNEITLGTVNRWCKGSVIWNLMLDSKRGPNRPGGCTTGFGAVDIDTDYKTIRKNSFYYIMAHMASVAKPDAVRIGAGGYNTSGLTYSAFKNADGTYAFVASNAGNAPLSFNVTEGTNVIPVTVPAFGIVSLLW